MNQISERHPAATPASASHDVIVVGAGVVGLSTAIAIARTGYRVACIGPAPRERNGRTVALLQGSVQFLAELGVWAAAAPLAAPLATMRIVDDTGSLFRGPPVDFVAADLGLPAFGFNIENAVLLEHLEAAAVATPGLTRTEDVVAAHRTGAHHVEADLASGGQVSARLLVAADGARSAVRERAGIACRSHRYPQVALTTILHHRRPHRSISTEFHTRQGPFTLVPMGAEPDAPNRSSLVWVMSPDEAERRAALPRDAFASEIERQSRFLLGAVHVAGDVGRFPITRVVADTLVAPRLALAGEAAHALPPIGAQGLNLSLRDAATLADILAAAQAAGHDPGAETGLARYASARRGDIALRVGGVDALNGALLSQALPVDALRGAGLAALRLVGPLRQAVMQQGLGLPRRAARSA